MVQWVFLGVQYVFCKCFGPWSKGLGSNIVRLWSCIQVYLKAIHHRLWSLFCVPSTRNSFTDTECGYVSLLHFSDWFKELHLICLLIIFCSAGTFMGSTLHPILQTGSIVFQLAIVVQCSECDLVDTTLLGWLSIAGMSWDWQREDVSITKHKINKAWQHLCTICTFVTWVTWHIEA